MKESLDEFQLAAMILLYLIHPSIMMDVISSIRCDPVPGSGTSYLRADMSIDCKSPNYKFFLKTSWMYLFVYVFGGMIALLYRGLYHNAKSGKLFVPFHPATKKYSFFVQGFTRESYYWEVIVMWRKLAVAALSTLLSPVLQLAWANVFLVISLFGNVLRKPFADDYINHLESATLVVLLLTVLIGTHFLAIEDTGYSPAILLLLLNVGWSLFLLALFAQRFRKWFRSSRIGTAAAQYISTLAERMLSKLFPQDSRDVHIVEMEKISTLNSQPLLDEKDELK